MPAATELNTGAVLPAVVAHYFDAFNGRDTEALVPLFDPQALLIAPVNVQVRGIEAIVAYIAEKGRGLTAEPEACECRGQNVVVLGHVRGPAFRVRAVWVFELSAQRIVRLRVRLLATMQELLPFRE